MLMIVSARSGEGKTSTSVDFDMAAASTVSTVLLVDADMPRSSLSATLARAASHDLAPHVSGDPSFEPLLLTVWCSGGANGAEADWLGHWPGAHRLNPADLCKRMTLFIAEARERYVLAIFDTAPLTLAPDAMPLLRQGDGVAVVVRFGLTTRVSAAVLAEQLRNLKAPALVWFSSGVSGGYGHGSQPDASLERPPKAEPTDVTSR